VAAADCPSTLTGEGAMRFFSCPSRDSRSRRAGRRAVARTRPALLRSPPPAEAFCPTSSTLLASGAPPSPFGRPRGFPLLDRTRGTRVPRDPLLEFGSSSEPVASSSARIPLRRTSPLTRTSSFQGFRVRLSWGSCSLEHHYVGCPFHRRNRFQSLRWTRSRHDPAGAVLRVLAPLDGFGCARGTARTLARFAVSPWRPDASRPYSMPLASLWSCPPELSLPEEPCPLSRASLCSLAGSRSTTASAT